MLKPNENSGNNGTNIGNAHLLINKVRVAEIKSEHSIIVEVLDGSKSTEGEYSLVKGDIICVNYSDTNERAIELISKLNAGSIVNISRHNTTKPSNIKPYKTLECTGIDIYDSDGENVIEYF
ncbi:hypothetical protein EHE19_012630 [Ruminiclostridium herbifermentans]|uniref:Uncharacterized protein n=1 Tax=Ruminiclostridium herbifermentans TaxID=2488810 RepID=A0A4U7JFR6_9FIRM|nr:hypothetical protein [Ruminiclostridium herbifermentans]QNU65755.1 hypothetical protein EHE19_012630 [Ruminiclostridium herbifermentans]